MVDYTGDFRFGALLRATERIIEVLDAGGVKDTRSLVDRATGWHNLQGHMRSIVPLTVWLALQRPDLLCTVRAATNLNTFMARHSPETDGAFWEDVKVALVQLLADHGDDRIVAGERANSPTTPNHIAMTYLPDDYGGGQTTGGGGTAVLKRTLKLLSHTLPLGCT